MTHQIEVEEKTLFQIMYEMHPRGVSELRYLGREEKTSANFEYFAEEI
jgi:hypothetical protein